MTIRFDGRVAIVTGAGNGLGRVHALELAKLGAKVIVNDFGGSRDGKGNSSDAALAVVEEIRKAGGQAIANGANVADFEQVTAMVEQAKAGFGRIDILINNAGILRDKTFAKMEMADFRAVVDVHLMGSAYCTKAVWETMREQNYGRVLMTTSAAGLFGNFGQANYGAAKMAVVGLMNMLAIEGKKNDIRINTLAPMAATRMTEDILPEAILKATGPGQVTPGALFLVSENAPNKVVLGASGGVFSAIRLVETEPVYISSEDLSADAVQAQFERITDWSTSVHRDDANQQVHAFVTTMQGAPA
ncbi:SDR family NAD(P)-dependent oxidoreductase [Paraburkholderia sartisoli]|uniref:NAD(P)-dependent dehydrogenase, short-chain alcohol dehydrogenase family n=1 Tax=Paraburkholderia sartisoli TaxID=83784 RepID=A0A1H4B1J4_9BURK|nr:SDR family NAD(P)-dependent oxidoreductase [Paraburkholderia sartisoli]SEA41944.1 NAD(P)-dependent dehydrogenase, short-chain alcohol dehydrogenase family [Paraburkholderia sartisoli]